MQSQAPGASAIFGQFPSRECMCPPYIESSQIQSLAVKRLQVSIDSVLQCRWFFGTPLGTFVYLDSSVQHSPCWTDCFEAFFGIFEKMWQLSMLLKTSIQAQIPRSNSEILVSHGCDCHFAWFLPWRLQAKTGHVWSIFRFQRFHRWLLGLLKVLLSASLWTKLPHNIQ